MTPCARCTVQCALLTQFGIQNAVGSQKSTHYKQLFFTEDSIEMRFANLFIQNKRILLHHFVLNVRF